MQLRIEGTASRTGLGATLAMNGASMTRLTQSLLALGLIEELDSFEAPVRGRPMVPLGVAGQGGWAIGATPHPGWLELALVDFRGRALIHDRTPFESADPCVFARIVEERLRMLAGTHGFMRGRFLGMGVAVPGYVLPGTGDHRAVVHRLADWDDVPLKDILGDALGMPVWIENDASAAALAEYYQDGMIGRYRSVLTLFLGHGIGGGLIAERDLFLGEHGNAGEVGRLFPGLHERPSGIDLLLTLRAQGVPIVSLSEIEPLLETQAPLIAAWTRRVIEQLDLVVQSGVAWLDPGAIVISGALPLSLLGVIAAGLDERCRNRDGAFRAALPVVRASAIGSKAVVIGAAMIPIHAVTVPE